MEAIGTVIVIIVIVYVIWSLLTRRRIKYYTSAQDIAREYLTVYEMISNEIANYPPERKYQSVVQAVFNKGISNEYVDSDLAEGAAYFARLFVSDANEIAKRKNEPLSLRHVVGIAAAAEFSSVGKRSITESEMTSILLGVCEVIPDHL